MHNASENNDAVCVAGRSQVLGKLLENAGVSAADIQTFHAYVEGGTVPLDDTNKFCDALKTRSILVFTCSRLRELPSSQRDEIVVPKIFFTPST